MKRLSILIGSSALLLVLGVLAIVFFAKYRTSDIMHIPVQEILTSEYPEDPSHRSVRYNQYGNRELTLVKKDDTHFDFIFHSKDSTSCSITFKNIDLSLYIPVAPVWTRDDSNLEIIALVDREWNRQQVKFPLDSKHLEIQGGDGFEKKHLVSAELARNCLNAGLWEILLFTEENGQKSLYYQGWFTFPLGHYKKIFETLNDSSYWSHWYRLEHWFDPVGTYVNLNSLRKISKETKISTLRRKDEEIIAAGEQQRKKRTISAKNVRCWGDFCEDAGIQYASFIPPGRYSVDHPWEHEYERIADLKQTYVRTIQVPNSDIPLHEIELYFKSSRTGKPQRFIVSGFDLNALPTLPVDQYNKGLYMPMGIGVSPFYQSYEELKKNRPYKSPYFSLLLDENDKWINHHEVAIDGPVLHRDLSNPNLIHLYLLSYERHSLVGHFLININGI